MARSGPSKVGLVLALLLVAKTATTDEKCKSGCQGGSSLFKYAEGTTYKYNYEGSIEITLSTAEGQQSLTKVKATVLLTQLPQCNQLLRLQDVQVIGSDNKKYSKLEGIDKPIRVNFNDGRLDDTICVEPGDQQNSINIKRAIASSFQASLKNEYETDVFGRCPTDITEHKEGGAVVINKNRVLNKCAFRENLKQDFLATALNLNSEIKSSPILNGDYSATQRIKNGILDQATITEYYLYMPFSVGKNGAKATVVSKLQYVGTSKEAPKSKVSEPRSIIFENPHPVNAPRASVNSILTAVKAVTNTIDQVVSQNTAKEFVDLVKIVRESKKDDLLGVYNQVRAGVGFKDKEIGKKVFLDALFRAGTGEAIEVAIDLLKNKELSPVEQKLVYLGLSFVKHATKSSLSSVAALLDQPNLPREAYLGAGALAKRFCKSHPCAHVNELKQLTQKLVSKLGKGKASNRKEENDIIYVLKGLGNLAFLSDDVEAKVTAIAQDNAAPIRLRVAAIDAYLADPCSDKIRNSALGILKDINLDSELRIKAYLVLAECPNGKIAGEIKSLLENEPSYQVGGFIVSHLRSIRSSANPDKELAKQQLGAIVLPSRFPFDPRRYSFNGEFSFAIDSLGIANSLESNVIFSQNSFLPRSTSLNLTTELFGHSFNFLEIATRQENFDRLLEHYVGPVGLFTKEAHKIVKRDVRGVQIKTNELNRDLDIDLSVKLFGSEFLFLNLNEDITKYNPEALLEKVNSYFEKGIEEAKSIDKSIRSNLLFLDVELAYPTSLGFPLRLAVEGSSSVQVKAKGSIDIPALQKLDKDVEVKLSLIPSANIAVSGRFTIDTEVIENGLKVSSTVYTATGGDLKVIVYEGGRGFDVKFGLPIEKQEIISATHDIVFSSREQGQTEKNQLLKFSQNKDFSICFDQLSKFIGLTACGTMNGPNLSGDHVPILPFPFNGNSRYIVTIEKEKLKEYHFKALTYTKEKLGFEVVGEALGPEGDRKVAIEVQGFFGPERYLKAAFISPIKNLEVEGRLILNDKEKALQGQFKNDNLDYYAKIGVAVSGSASKSVYKPIFEYRTPSNKDPQTPPYNVEGQIVVEQGAETYKYTLDNVKVNSPNQKPIIVQGNFGKEPGALFTDVKVSFDQNSVSLKGRYQGKPDLHKVNVEFQNTINPQANFDLTYEFKKNPDSIQNSVQLIHGKDLSSKTNILTIVNEVTYKYKSANDYVIGSKSSFSYPLINANAKFEFENTPKSIDYNLEANYKDVKVSSELDLKYAQKKFGDYQLEFELYGFNTKVDIESKREILGEGEKSKIGNKIEINGQKLEVDGTVSHRVQPENIDVGADLVIKLTKQPNPIKLSTSFILNPNEIDSQVKLSAGSNNYIDIFFKGTKGGNANGSIKINVKDNIIANGQIKSIKGAGSGDVVFEFPKTGRKIKIDGKFTINEPTYNVEVALYPQLDKDPSKKLYFSTHNKVTDSAVDSKNVADVLGEKLEVNAKGKWQGGLSFNSTGDGELEVILPNDLYFLAKYVRDAKLIGDVANGYALASLEYRKNRNAPGAKVSLKGNAKDSDFKAGVLDLTYNFAADDSNGKTFNSDLSIKRSISGDGAIIDVQSKAYGSVLEKPVESSFNYDHKGKKGKYKIVSTYGNENKLDINGEYEASKESFSGKFNTDLKSSFSKLRVLKINIDGTGSCQKSADESFTSKGSFSIFADDDGTQKDATVDFSTQGEISIKKQSGLVKGTIKNQNLDPISGSLSYNYEPTKFKGDLEVNYAKGKTIKAALGAKYPKENQGAVEIIYRQPEFVFEYDVEADIKDIEDFLIKSSINSPQLKLNKIEGRISNREGKGKKRIQIAYTSQGKDLISGSLGYKVHQEGGKFIVEGSGDLKVKGESKPASFKYISQNVYSEENAEKGTEITFEAGLGGEKLDIEYTITNKHTRFVESYCEDKKQCALVAFDSKIITNDISNFNHELEISIDLRKLGLSHEIGIKAVTVRKQFAFDHTVDVHFQKNPKNKYQYSVYLNPKEAGVSLTTPKRVIAAEATISGEKAGPYKAKAGIYLDKNNKNSNPLASLEGSLSIQNPYKGEVALYLRNKSNQKGKPLRASITANVFGFTDKSEVTGASADLVLDVFASEANKLIITGQTSFGKQEANKYEGKTSVEFKSPGLGINVKAGENLLFDLKDYIFRYKVGLRYNVEDSRYDSGVAFTANPKQVDGSIKFMNKDLFNFNSKLKLEKDSQVVDTTYEIAGDKPVVTYFELKNYNTVKYTIARKENPSDKLEVNSGLIIGQVADFRIDAIIGGAKKEFARATVKLDDANFLKTDYGYSSENIKKYFLEPTKKALDDMVKKDKQTVIQLSKDVEKEWKTLYDILKGAAYEFSGVRDYVLSEAQKIEDEILSDQSIKEINEFFKGIIGTFVSATKEIFTKFGALVESLAKTVQANFGKIADIFNKDILPKLRETLEKIGHLVVDNFQKFSDVVITYIAKISDFIDEHKKDFQEISSALTAGGQDIGRFVIKIYESIRALVTEQYNTISEQLRSQPYFEELKNQLEMIRKEYIDVDKFSQKVDLIRRDIQGAVEEFIKNIGEAIKRLVDNAVAIDLGKPGVQPFNLEYIARLPRLVAIKFSPLTYLLSGGLQSPLNLLFSLSLNPRYWVPPLPLYGLIVQGQHIFTFDGNHITFPGKCDYLLARDALDGNFTLVGTYTNGLLTAITLSDKSDSITIKKGGQVLYNNAPAEFPVVKSNLIGYRTYIAVGLYSKNGAHIVCGTELVGCGVHISGFYFGRIRGLLGNGNGEPFDDFILPNGKLSKSANDFANAYKISKSCPDVKTVDHAGHHPSPSCAKLFGYDSSFKYCYKFVDPANYKTACEHGVAGGVKNTENAIAVGYTAACNERGIPVRVPEEFVKCSNGEQAYKVGESFSVKTPGKSADILLLVDKRKYNEPVYKEFVVPLVQKLNQELNAKGISDVEYHLVTYGGDVKTYPAHITIGGKLTFKGKAPALQFSDSADTEPYQLDCSKLNKNKFSEYIRQYLRTDESLCPKLNRGLEYIQELLHDFNLAIGNNVQARTYADAIKYPFRAESVKTIIAVTGEQCEVGDFYGLQLLNALLYRNNEIFLNLVTPLKSFGLKDPKHTKETVGFNKDSVFTVSLAKKKPEGSTELYKHLEYTDYCSRFTVSSGGNVFITDNFLESKGGNRNQFVQVAAHNIVDQITSIEKNLDCECVYTTPFTAENKCKVVSSKDRSAQRKA